MSWELFYANIVIFTAMLFNFIGQFSVYLWLPLLTLSLFACLRMVVKWLL